MSAAGSGRPNLKTLGRGGGLCWCGEDVASYAIARYLQLVTSVAILGGGVGGLSAAHELSERGFDVTVYEWRDRFGGKARSMPVPDSGTGGRPDLPAEHGFRFFPGFYRHVIDTMERIPCAGGKVVAGHLVDATRILLAQADGRNELILPARWPSSINDLAVFVQVTWDFAHSVRIPPWELAWFMGRLLTLLTSCDERRLNEWELKSWWDYTSADKLSDNFQKFLADGLTRTLVAAQAKEMSARTGGLILCQLLFDMMRAGGSVDRVLDGPTSDVWIDPWRVYLQSVRGVSLRNNCKVTQIHCDGGLISGVTVEGPDGSETVVADHYVAALPVEQLQPLVKAELVEAEPRLAKLNKLRTRWMNGVMFYLDKDVALQRGHTIFIDSEWALTAISQAQFWPNVDLEDFGDGQVDGVLSVDVSEWERPSKHTGLMAKECTDKQICDEVWRQMVDHIDDGSLQQANVLRCFVDPAIQIPNPSKHVNLEPLLINTAGSWDDRPEAITKIPNFFLAADFVRTYTDLATMEGANEAARRAVNGILDATHSSASRCRVWKLREPAVLAPLRELDRLRWQLERPFTPYLRVTEARALELTGVVTQGLRAAARHLG